MKEKHDAWIYCYRGKPLYVERADGRLEMHGEPLTRAEADDLLRKARQEDSRLTSKSKGQTP